MNIKNRKDITNLRRSQLTKAAYKIVSKKGYNNFTIKQIAREAKLSTGLVHYYFKNKQDLLLNLLKEMNKNVKKYLNEGLRNLNNPVDKLDLFISQAFELIKNEKNYFYVLFDFWAQTNRNERMRSSNIKLFQSYREECSKILQEGIYKGIFKTIDIKYTSTLIISLIQGIIIQHVIDNKAFEYDQCTKKAIDLVKELVIKK